MTEVDCDNLQVTILGRHEQDELLLLASDGLWDVLSNQVCLISTPAAGSPVPVLYPWLPRCPARMRLFCPVSGTLPGLDATSSCCSPERVHRAGGVFAGEAVPEEGAAAGREPPLRRPHRRHRADARRRGPRVPGQCHRRGGRPVQVCYLKTLKPFHSHPALLRQRACSVLKRPPAVQRDCLQQHRAEVLVVWSALYKCAIFRRHRAAYSGLGTELLTGRSSIHLQNLCDSAGNKW